MNNIEIRQIDAESAKMVFGLFDQYRVFYGQSSDLPLAERFISERLQNNESIIFVAINEHQIPVGFTQLYPSYSSVRTVKNWILNDLFVEETHRKQGIGEKLIQAAMAFAACKGAKFVQLETAVDNYTAQRLYEAIGFEKQEPSTTFLLYKINVNNDGK